MPTTTAVPPATPPANADTQADGASSGATAAAIVTDALEAGPAAGTGVGASITHDSVCQIEEGPAVSIMLMSLPGAKLTPFELDRDGVELEHGALRGAMGIADPDEKPSAIFLLSDPQCMDALVLSRMDDAFPTATMVGGVSLTASSIFNGRQQQADRNAIDDDLSGTGGGGGVGEGGGDAEVDEVVERALKTMGAWGGKVGSESNTATNATGAKQRSGWTAASAVAAGIVVTSERFGVDVVACQGCLPIGSVP